MTERWRTTVGFPDYEVSDQGRVRRKTPPHRNGGCGRCQPGRILAPGKSNGYLFVGLMRDGKQYVRRIHILVAEAFLSPMHFPHEFVIHHKNGRRTDNRVTNLEYLAQRDHARLHIYKGENSQARKAAIRRQERQEEIRAIRRRYDEDGIPMAALAREFGWSISGISLIVRRKRHADLL